jgi:hypothetical protein
MSLSISAVNLSNPLYDPSSDVSAGKTAQVKPTATQQIQLLASSGQSASLIASSLGIPVAQVDSVLGISSSSTTEASALVALSGRLSVHG